MPDGLAYPQRFFAFLTIVIALTMAVLDGAIVNVALPTIQRELAVSSADSVWIINAYQLAIIVFLLPLAALGDSIGYRKVYWCGLAVFTLASFACAMSGSFLALSLARVVQGIGAAGIMSVNIALVRFIFPKDRLGAGIGYNALVVAVSSAAGPSIASSILTLGSWQWLFLVNVPLGLIALVIAARSLPVTPAAGKPFNFQSFILNALTFGFLIAGLNSLSDSKALDTSLWMLGIACVAGAFFVRRELKLTTPMLPVDLLKRPIFALSILTSFGSFAAQTMAYVSLPFYLEETLGYSAAMTGLLLTPWPVMTGLIAPLSGRLSNRIAPQFLGVIGLVFLGSGLALMAVIGDHPSVLDISWRLAICGVGFGLFQAPNNRIIISSAPPERSGGASGLQSTGRLLGQSTGAALVAVIFGLVQGHDTILILWLAAALAFAAACTSGLRRPSI
ncbi:MFS transporter [Microvirga sp. W0021]|uniref:MFS transporter n=1 Tax=Hohaiivirga grylli TaxID=3133970 RepID=A0ABV0BMZ1_9HYPH